MAALPNSDPLRWKPTKKIGASAVSETEKLDEH